MKFVLFLALLVSMPLAAHTPAPAVNDTEAAPLSITYYYLPG